MLKKQVLFSIALLTSATLYAVPIESRGLSGQNASDVIGPAAPITGNMNWDLMQKNQQLENQIRELRGKLEEQDNAIEQLNKELSNRYTDLDQRLELMAQKLEADTESTDETPPDETTPEEQKPTENQSNETAPIATTPKNQTPTEPSVQGEGNTSSAQDLEKAAYSIALEAYKQGGAKKAIEPMQSFIKNNPNSIYTGNAYFWLAEFNLAIDPPNYEEAKKNYEVVAAKYGNSSKAPRALYRLYSIATEVNKNPQTANVYKNKLLSAFPDSEEANFLKNS